MRAWVDVATLAKPRNLDGRFVAVASAGLPFLLEPGDEVALVPPKLDVPRSVTVASVKPIDASSAELRFEEVSDADVAGELVGMHCLIRRDLIDEDALADTPALWEGWEVVDVTVGPIGTVVDFIENPGQTLVEVSYGTSTVLVPFVDDIVLDVDVKSGTIEVDLPNGLLELSVPSDSIDQEQR